MTNSAAAFTRRIAKLIIRAERDGVETTNHSAVMLWLNTQEPGNWGALANQIAQGREAIEAAGVTVKQAAGIVDGKIVADRDGKITKAVLNGQRVDNAIGQPEYVLLSDARCHIISTRSLKRERTEYVVEWEAV